MWGELTAGTGYEDREYITDPRNYGIWLFEEPVSDEEFERDYRHRVKAFLEPDHAVQFAHQCNLDGVTVEVYDLCEGKWTYNLDATGRLSRQIG